MKTVSEISILTPETCLMFNCVTEVGFSSVFVPNQLVTEIPLFWNVRQGLLTDVCPLPDISPVKVTRLSPRGRNVSTTLVLLLEKPASFSHPVLSVFLDCYQRLDQHALQPLVWIPKLQCL